MRLCTRVAGVGLAVMLSAGAGGAQAALVTLSGTFFEFEYDDSTVLGTARVTTTAGGDRLQFAPTRFVAAASNDSGATVEVPATLVVTVRARPGADPDLRVGSVLAQARGDYRFRDKDAADGFSQPFVTASGELRVKAGSNEAADPLGAGGFTPTFPSLSLWAASGATANTPEDVADWGQTSVVVTLESSLAAGTFALGDTALIQAKRFDLEVVAHYVPLPAAAWMLTSALMGLGMIGRRRGGRAKARSGERGC
jgi:hypothetical protein